MYSLRNNEIRYSICLWFKVHAYSPVAIEITCRFIVLNPGWISSDYWSNLFDMSGPWDEYELNLGATLFCWLFKFDFKCLLTLMKPKTLPFWHNNVKRCCQCIFEPTFGISDFSKRQFVIFFIFDGDRFVLVVWFFSGGKVVWRQGCLHSLSCEPLQSTSIVNL